MVKITKFFLTNQLFLTKFSNYKIEKKPKIVLLYRTFKLQKTLINLFGKKTSTIEANLKQSSYIPLERSKKAKTFFIKPFKVFVLLSFQ